MLSKESCFLVLMDEKTVVYTKQAHVINMTKDSTVTHTESQFLPHKEHTPFPLQTSFSLGPEKQNGV